MNYAVVIVAAGRSSRFKADVNKLLYVLPDGLTVLEHSIRIFREDEDCQQIVIVTGEDTAVAAMSNTCGRESYARGGNSRAESVYNGLMAVNQEIVLVHDGARCFLQKEDLQSLKQAMETERAALLVGDEVDTIKQVKDGYVVCSIDRDQLKRAQTPQAFYFNDLFAAYRKALQANVLSTDEAGVMEQFSDIKIKCVKAQGKNIKVTTLEDIL